MSVIFILKLQSNTEGLRVYNSISILWQENNKFIIKSQSQQRLDQPIQSLKNLIPSWPDIIMWTGWYIKVFITVCHPREIQDPKEEPWTQLLGLIFKTFRQVTVKNSKPWIMNCTTYTCHDLEKKKTEGDLHSFNNYFLSFISIEIALYSIPQCFHINLACKAYKIFTLLSF